MVKDLNFRYDEKLSEDFEPGIFYFSQVCNPATSMFSLGLWASHFST